MTEEAKNKRRETLKRKTEARKRAGRPKNTSDDGSSKSSHKSLIQKLKDDLDKAYVLIDLNQKLISDLKAQKASDIRDLSKMIRSLMKKIRGLDSNYRISEEDKNVLIDVDPDYWDR